jgi:TM2 domain-containing membrane protein YozV
MNTKSTSYLLWALWLFGLAGIHRFYNKKYGSGIFWLITWGCFGIGQMIDLLLIPEMVDEHNYRERLRLGATQFGMLPQATVQWVVPSDTAGAMVANTQPSQNVIAQTNTPPTKEQRMITLLKAAQARGGKLSVTQGVLDTGLSFEEVEATLKEMVKSGYVAATNDPHTGVVTYDFIEL